MSHEAKLFSRREFLKTSSLVALAPNVPGFLQRTARAAEVQRDERILVVIQLSGGNDGLNTVVPFADDGYAKHRAALRLPEERLHKIDEGLGLHPSMKDAADLFEQQRLAIVQGVGYPNPNRSHDVSMAIWHTARFDREEHSGYGWIGRALDELPPPRRNAPASVLVDRESTPAALRGRKCVSTSFTSVEELLTRRDVRVTAGSDTAADNLAAFVSRTALDASTTADLLREIAGKDRTAAAYPSSELAARLRLVSQLVQADFGTRVYYAMQDGYDTHSTQLNQHARLLRELSQALRAFLDDLASAGLEDRVLVLCFSEFGRQVQENASAGTDHGTAGPVLVAGASVAGGLLGASPDLSALDDNAPRHEIDFRSVYATILGQWLGLFAVDILGGDFTPLPLLA
ncbi:MAG: DUF1501 domain-containing protein [Planctomycetaceae bacterium]